MELLGYTFVWKRYDTMQRYEVNDFLEEEGKLMVEYINGDE